VSLYTGALKKKRAKKDKKSSLLEVLKSVLKSPPYSEFINWGTKKIERKKVLHIVSLYTGGH
jgi:hypothetical protein